VGSRRGATDESGCPFFAAVFRLTWDGADFLDAARSDTLWHRALAEVIAQGKSFTFDLLKAWLRHQIATGCGL
jgi:hypothetical protein